METLPCTVKEFWKGSLFASIAHAVWVSRCPDFSFANSWDGVSYSAKDGSGSQGTATFQFEKKGFPIRCAGAVFSLDSPRRQLQEGLPADPLQFFDSADQAVIELAKISFQYMLDDFEGEALPHVTAGFWSNGELMYSSDPFHSFLSHGGHVFEIPFSPIDQATTRLLEQLELTPDELTLVHELYRCRTQTPGGWVSLDPKQRRFLELNGEGFEESTISLAELKIQVA